MPKRQLALFAAALLCASAAQATVVKDLDLAGLTRAATRVVHGVVTGEDVQWDKDAHLVTETTVAVTETLKGRHEKTVIVRQVGGSKDGYEMRVPGSPRLSVGEEVVLFLEPQPDKRGTFVPVAMSLGKWKVEGRGGQKLVTRDLQGLGLARPSPQGLKVAPPPRAEPAQPLADFKKRVKALVRGGK